MTDPLTRISTIQETGKKKEHDARLKHDKYPRHAEESEEDSIDISKEAREKAAGRTHRNIIDYINEEPE